MLNLRHLDFNMLIAFDLLMRERNVSRAAEKMFVTQPAMSHILQRLRQQFDDLLLVKTPAGMQPTARALALVAPVRAVLRDVEELLQSPAPFDPGVSHEHFVIAGSDYMEFLVLPRLIQRVREVAPSIEIRIARADPDAVETGLQDQRWDLIVGFEAMLRLPKYLARQRLFEDTIVCIARRDHPEIGDTLSREDYLQRHQLLISSCDLNAHLLEAWLRDRGLERRVSVTVPNFLSAPFTVATTDLLLSAPRRIAAGCIGFSDVKVIPLPFELPAYDLVMAWHPLQENNPAHRWLREQLTAVGRAIDPLPCDRAA